LSPTALARLAALHDEMAELYRELAAAPAPVQPAEDRAIGILEASRLLNCSRAKRERGPRR